MAQRPIFVPQLEGDSLVRKITVEFTWHPGMSRQQKQKSIESLHAAAARDRGFAPLLEISSKSKDPVGVKLSAFNLSLQLGNLGKVPVEVAFQGSKVFEKGGPYTELYGAHPREAKKDERLKNSGNLVRFEWLGQSWPLTPPTAFYDWLYLNALKQNEDLARQLLQFKGFTDIEFNPNKSINCQAYSAALYVALVQREQLAAIWSSRETFLKAVAGRGTQTKEPIQLNFADIRGRH